MRQPQSKPRPKVHIGGWQLWLRRRETSETQVVQLRCWAGPEHWGGPRTYHTTHVKRLEHQAPFLKVLHAEAHSGHHLQGTGLSGAQSQAQSKGSGAQGCHARMCVPSPYGVGRQPARSKAGDSLKNNAALHRKTATGGWALERTPRPPGFACNNADNPLCPTPIRPPPPQTPTRTRTHTREEGVQWSENQ
jgi:hypothetical protein